jgi:hypothetical protein
LAAELAVDDSSTRALWHAVLPTREDLNESMPLLWGPGLQNLLPPASQALLENQHRKLALDWPAFTKAFPEVRKDDYIYAWVIVNTRTFYYLLPGTKRKPKPDDCMALNPFADYFNHSSRGCEVLFDKSCFQITTDRKYEAGEEIYISYGQHSNDFLLAEYGFIMESNEWDELKLDTVLLPELSDTQKEELKDAGFLGNYVLDKETFCYRTQVGLRILCLPLGRWRRYVDGLDDGDKEQPEVDAILLRLLQKYVKIAQDRVNAVSELKTGLSCQREILGKRWLQILDLLHNGINQVQR